MWDVGRGMSSASTWTSRSRSHGGAGYTSGGPVRVISSQQTEIRPSEWFRHAVCGWSRAPREG